MESIRSRPVMPHPGLYDARYEHDSCGTGFVASIQGHPSHKIVEDALIALGRLAHRGAVAADGKSSDGVGILTAIPRGFLLHAAGVKLSPEQPLAVGMFFLPRQSPDSAANQFERAATEQGMQLLAWRDVPLETSVLGASAMESLPVIRQALLTHEVARSPATPAGAIWSAACISPGSNLNAPGRVHMYARFPVRRSSTKRCAPDGFCHSSILTCGSLNLSHRLRYFISGMPPTFAVLASGPTPARPGAQRRNQHDLGQPRADGGTHVDAAARKLSNSSENGSDSTSLDEAVELLARTDVPWLNPSACWYLRPCSRCIRHFSAIMPTVLNHGTAPPRYLCGRQPRWRSARPKRTAPLPLRGYAARPGRRRLRGRPGRSRPRRCVRKRPRGSGADARRGSEGAPPVPRSGTACAVRPRGIVRRTAGEYPARAHSPQPAIPAEQLQHLQRNFGYTREDTKIVLPPMALDGKDAIWSMGDDTPIAPLSATPRSLYAYFRQRFAQVTNPPIDPLRESCVFSLRTRLGPWPDLLNRHARLPGLALDRHFFHSAKWKRFVCVSIRWEIVCRWRSSNAPSRRKNPCAPQLRRCAWKPHIWWRAARAFCC